MVDHVKDVTGRTDLDFTVVKGFDGRGRLMMISCNRCQPTGVYYKGLYHLLAPQGLPSTFPLQGKRNARKGCFIFEGRISNFLKNLPKDL